MIKQEIVATRMDGTKLIRTFSDEGMYIQQERTGILYEEAVDPEDAGETYIETDRAIPAEKN